MIRTTGISATTQPPRGVNYHTCWTSHVTTVLGNTTRLRMVISTPGLKKSWLALCQALLDYDARYAEPPVQIRSKRFVTFKLTKRQIEFSRKSIDYVRVSLSCSSNIVWIIALYIFCLCNYAYSQQYNQAMNRWKSIAGKLKKLDNSKMSPTLGIAKPGMTPAGILNWCDQGNIYDLLKDRRDNLDR